MLRQPHEKTRTGEAYGTEEQRLQRKTRMRRREGEETKGEASRFSYRYICVREGLARKVKREDEQSGGEMPDRSSELHPAREF